MKKFNRILSSILALLILTSVSFHPETIYAKNTKYHIKVNRLTNSATVYELNEKGKYEPIKAMLCGTGGPLTPLGTFYTPQKNLWNPFYAGSFGRYSTRITGHYLFHSIPFNRKSPDTMIKGHFNRLGTNSSAGCVRLAVADAKWIFENCELGTKVTIYEDKNPGPLGKPEPYFYPEDNGYDPSDIWSKDNPILKKEPKITAKGDLIVEPDDNEVNLLKGVKATSFQGFDITDKITFKDNINYSKPGKYKITYRVKDLLKKEASFTRTVIVK